MHCSNISKEEKAGANLRATEAEAGTRKTQVDNKERESQLIHHTEVINAE